MAARDGDPNFAHLGFVGTSLTIISALAARAGDHFFALQDAVATSLGDPIFAGEVCLGLWLHESVTKRVNTAK